jgi:hypothetical protein
VRRLVLALMALTLAGCDEPAHPDLPPLQSGPASNTLYNPEWSDSDTADIATAFCEKYASCLKLGAAALADCKARAPKLSALIPDLASFLACFEKISCDKLESLNSAVLGCLDLEARSVSCKADALHYCNTEGKCIDVSCSDFCAAVEGSSTGTCSKLGIFCTCGKNDAGGGI